jgi:hypothetical protein
MSIQNEFNFQIKIFCASLYQPAPTLSLQYRTHLALTGMSLVRFMDAIGGIKPSFKTSEPY